MIVGILIDLTGKIFEGYIVIERAEKPKYVTSITAGAFWRCRCNCGRERVISTTSLIHCGIKPCKCIEETQKQQKKLRIIEKNKEKYNDLVGKKLGKLTILGFTNRERIVGVKKEQCVCLECKCDCGNIVHKPAYRIKAGKGLSCGCGSIDSLKELNKHRRINMVGKKFGRLTVIKLSENRARDGELKYECNCDCGKSTLVRGVCLRNGTTKSCGCLKAESSKLYKINTKVKIGDIYGRLTVLKQAQGINGHTRWLCKCTCGTIKEYDVGKFNSKQARNSAGIISCGCYIEEERKKKMVGKTFNDLKVIDKAKTPTGIKSKQSYWLCECICGNPTIVSGTALKLGSTKSCGCLKFRKRVGRHISREGYVVLYMPEHPNARKGGTIFEHTVVMTEKLKRPLKDNENIHHKNGDKSDNDKTNLVLCSDNHPHGQYVTDKFEFALNFIYEYMFDSSVIDFKQDVIGLAINILAEYQPDILTGGEEPRETVVPLPFVIRKLDEAHRKGAVLRFEDGFNVRDFWKGVEVNPSSSKGA